MDFSESQRQQYQQPPYDSSQSQSYYPYQPYYQTDYTTTSSAAAAYQQPAQDSIPILPPGVSAAPEPPPQPVISFQPQQQNPYYPVPTAPEQQLNLNASYPGLNHAAAAAVAALSQLTQFAGSMDAAEKARAGMHERQWQGEPMQMQLHVGPHGVYQAGPVVGHRVSRSFM